MPTLVYANKQDLLGAKTARMHVEEAGPPHPPPHPPPTHRRALRLPSPARSGWLARCRLAPRAASYCCRRRSSWSRWTLCSSRTAGCTSRLARPRRATGWSRACRSSWSRRLPRARRFSLGPGPMLPGTLSPTQPAVPAFATRTDATVATQTHLPLTAAIVALPLCHGAPNGVRESPSPLFSALSTTVCVCCRMLCELHSCAYRCGRPRTG